MKRIRRRDSKGRFIPGSVPAVPADAAWAVGVLLVVAGFILGVWLG